MQHHQKYYPVHWIDGMKVNKSHFIAQDNAFHEALHDMAACNLSPHRYGVLPPPAAGESTFQVKIAVENKHTLHVVVEACQAVTPGGMPISLPAFSSPMSGEPEAPPEFLFPFALPESESNWWVVLVVHPFEKQPAGSPCLSENIPRLPYVLPAYSIEVVRASRFRQFMARTHS